MSVVLFWETDGDSDEMSVTQVKDIFICGLLILYFMFDRFLVSTAIHFPIFYVAIMSLVSAVSLTPINMCPQSVYSCTVVSKKYYGHTSVIQAW